MTLKPKGCADCPLAITEDQDDYTGDAGRTYCHHPSLPNREEIQGNTIKKGTPEYFCPLKKETLLLMLQIN